VDGRGPERSRRLALTNRPSAVGDEQEEGNSNTTQTGSAALPPAPSARTRPEGEASPWQPPKSAPTYRSFSRLHRFLNLETEPGSYCFGILVGDAA
jgi:hypothetical protein